MCEHSNATGGSVTNDVAQEFAVDVSTMRICTVNRSVGHTAFPSFRLRKCAIMERCGRICRGRVCTII